jgi:hypothetical protein
MLSSPFREKTPVTDWNVFCLLHFWPQHLCSLSWEEVVMQVKVLQPVPVPTLTAIGIEVSNVEKLPKERIYYSCNHVKFAQVFHGTFFCHFISTQMPDNSNTGCRH